MPACFGTTYTEVSRWYTSTGPLDAPLDCASLLDEPEMPGFTEPETPAPALSEPDELDGVMVADPEDDPAPLVLELSPESPRLAGSRSAGPFCGAVARFRSVAFRVAEVLVSLDVDPTEVELGDVEFVAVEPVWSIEDVLPCVEYAAGG